jgi:hypothetical protein
MRVNGKWKNRKLALAYDQDFRIPGGYNEEKAFLRRKNYPDRSYGWRKVDLSGIGLVEHGTGWLHIHERNPLYHRGSVFLFKKSPARHV